VKGFPLVIALIAFGPSLLWAGDAAVSDSISFRAGVDSLPKLVLQAGPSADVAVTAQATQQPQNNAPETKGVSSSSPATSQPSGQPGATQQQAPSVEAQPLGQSAGGAGLAGDIIEKKSNIVHPFLAVGGYFTDNVNNSHDNRKSDFGTIISPGIYFALPGLRERIKPVSTLNITPGGATLTGFRPDYPRTFQSYLYYRADIEAFATHSSLNTISHLVEGVAQYNMRGGLQVAVEDQFSLTHNQRGTGFSFGLDKYYANMAGLTAKYQLGEKSLIRLDYSNYYLHFLGTENSFRDRDDNRAAAYFFYKLWPKTAIFAQYEYVNTAYQEKTVAGSMEHHAFLGVRYDVTDKTRGMLKVGYGIKDFERSNLKTQSNLYAEAQLDHKFTEKTSVVLSAARRTDETDVSQAFSIVETTGDVTLLHRFTTKITGNVNVRFTDEKYNGSVTFGGTTKALHDQYLRAGASVLYEYRDWLNFSLGYYFTDRMSNISPLSYTNNTAFFRISAIY
jgi:polysaccharide biosynthesis protein VpsM